MFETKEIVTAIDIGTAKTCVVIAESDDSGAISVVGFGERPSVNAMSKGDVVDAGAISDALAEAVEEAEDTSGRQVDPANVLMSISGSHIESREGTGSVVITDRDRIVCDAHIEEAFRSAAIIPVPRDKQTFNTFNTHFTLDDDPERILINPTGQVAGKLTAAVHVILGNSNRIESLTVFMKNLGFDEYDPFPVFTGLASAFGTLHKEEMEKGVLLIDLGAGTTEYVLFHNTGLHASGVLPIGCDHIANDLSIELDLGIATCRKIILEQKYFASREEGKSVLEINPASRGAPRRIPIISIEKIVDARLNELFTLIRNELARRQLLRKIDSGLVLTGGGALIQQAPDTLSSVFNSPVRIGSPDWIGGAITQIRNPRYGTVCGLLKYGNLVSRIRGGQLPGSGVGPWLDQFSGNFLRKIGNVFRAFRI
jgi:cell division protein FtsA